MYSPVDVSRIQYMTNKQQRSARRKLAQKQLTRQLARVAVSTPKKKPKSKPFATVGQTLGTAVGSMFGAPGIGSGVGRWLGKGIGSIFGSGDYEMVGQNPSYNVLTNGAQIPKFSSTRATNVVSHREFLGDITGGTPFINRKFPINPGSSITFPWLSTIAQCYQQYKIHGLIFEFRPLITDFVTSGAPGVVIMATNYNADEPLYSTKQAMENSEFAVSVKPTCNLMHGVECAANQSVLSELYVRPGGLASNLDLKFTDLGNFQFASQGNPSQLLGELWVSYTIEFFKPLLPNDVGGNVQSISLNRSAVTAANPLGGIQLTAPSGDLVGFTFIDPSNFSFIAQPGNVYQMTTSWTGSTAAVAAYPAIILTNAVGFNSWINDATSTVQAPQAGLAGVLNMIQTITFTCNASAPSVVNVNFSAVGVFPTTNTNMSLLLTQVSDDI